MEKNEENKKKKSSTFKKIMKGLVVVGGAATVYAAGKRYGNGEHTFREDFNKVSGKVKDIFSKKTVKNESYYDNDSEMEDLLASEQPEQQHLVEVEITTTKQEGTLDSPKVTNYRNEVNNYKKDLNGYYRRYNNGGCKRSYAEDFGKGSN